MSVEAAAQEMCDIIQDTVFSGRKMTPDEQQYFDKLFEKALEEQKKIEAAH